MKIILGSIVTRCPSMSLAPSALGQLESACELFSKVAHLFHAEKTLVRLIKPPIPVGISATHAALPLPLSMLDHYVELA